jgi:hypothetical protein
VPTYFVGSYISDGKWKLFPKIASRTKQHEWKSWNPVELMFLVGILELFPKIASRTKQHDRPGYPFFFVTSR